MSDEELIEKARREAFRRYDGDRIVDENTGEEVSHDDWGYADTARQAFIAGAVWLAGHDREAAARTRREVLNTLPLPGEDARSGMLHARALIAAHIIEKEGGRAMSDEELIEKALSPEAVKHWQWAEAKRKRFDEKGCICYLCQSIPRILAVYREHTAPTDDDDREISAFDDRLYEVGLRAPESTKALLVFKEFRRGAPAEPAVTDEMVERGARAMNPEAWAAFDESENPMRRAMVQHTLKTVRPILEAALSTGRGEK